MKKHSINIPSQRKCKSKVISPQSEWLSSKIQTTNAEEDAGEKEASHTVGGNAN
jgi:hypothetical protein